MSFTDGKWRSFGGAVHRRACALHEKCVSRPFLGRLTQALAGRAYFGCAGRVHRLGRLRRCSVRGAGVGPTAERCRRRMCPEFEGGWLLVRFHVAAQELEHP